jgi:hypothetical protein
VPIDRRTENRPLIKNKHHHRLHRSARHLIRDIGRTSRGYTRTSVVMAQIRGLEHAVSIRENPGRRSPSLVRSPVGERVRIGHDVRELLGRLQVSRNLRVQQQLVRELRAAVERRIRVHRERSRRLQAARQNTKHGLQTAGAAGRTAGAWVGGQVSQHHARWTRPGPADRSVRPGPPARPRARLAIERAGRPMPDSMISRDAARVRRQGARDPRSRLAR